MNATKKAYPKQMLKISITIKPKSKIKVYISVAKTDVVAKTPMERQGLDKTLRPPYSVQDRLYFPLIVCHIFT
jgi:hypothetical protein